jgi:hypothetical protein
MGIRVSASVAWAFALVSAVGCTSMDADPRILTGTLVLDQDFEPEQREAIQAAIDRWSEATAGRFAPTLAFGEVACGEPFAIEAVHDVGCHVGQWYDEEETARVLGAADRGSHWVSVVTWLDGNYFGDNVAHELGHYMLLGHGDGIMAQAREGQGTQITESSIQEFCSIWGCEPDSPPRGRYRRH